MRLVRGDGIEPGVEGDTRLEGKVGTSAKCLQSSGSAERVSRHDGVAQVDATLPKRQVALAIGQFAKVGSDDRRSIALVDALHDAQHLLDLFEAHDQLLLAMLNL